MSQLFSEPWLNISCPLYKGKFQYKNAIGSKNGVRYREVSAIPVRYKKVFIWDNDRDFIRSYE